ncbi:MAG TPA: hypothetical protein VE664_08615 [Actinomycetes bacterium]|jgi:hypothetical protein|nr:hypothetical protein [Actinomycetes bacterium]
MTATAHRAPPPPETAYLLGGWGFLDDSVTPDAEAEYLAEVAWERRELLWAVARLPAPERDLLRSYLTLGLDDSVMAALHRLPEPLWWSRVAAAAELLAEQTPELAARLPEELRAALAAGEARSA